MTPPTPPTSSSGDKDHFLRKQTNWNSLSFYKKSDVLYLLTKHFTGKYLSLGDRTIDQMVQAARSGKQNIVEGMADGVTSSEQPPLRWPHLGRNCARTTKTTFPPVTSPTGTRRMNVRRVCSPSVAATTTRRTTPPSLNASLTRNSPTSPSPSASRWTR